MGLAGGHHVVVGLVLLEHQPHGADVVAGESPVALGVEVAHDQFLLQALLDASGPQRDLAGHERLAAARAFVIEQDPRAGEKAVGFPVIDRLPVAVELGAGVRAARVERRARSLRRRRRAVHLRARRLIELHRLAIGSSAAPPRAAAKCPGRPRPRYTAAGRTRRGHGSAHPGCTPRPAGSAP